MSDDRDTGYSVGYRRPPADTRFPAGHSGNPNGRPKGSKNMATVLSAELDTRLLVTENGKRKSASKRQLIVKQLVNKAAGGDLKAIPIVLGQAHTYEQMQATAATLDEKLSQADEIALSHLIARIRSTPDVAITNNITVDIVNSKSTDNSEEVP